MERLLAVANSRPMWLACGALVAVVLVQAMAFLRLCRREADRIGYPRSAITRAAADGAVTAVGPALAASVVMLTMMTFIGGPVTWQRFNVIGAVQTEPFVAQTAAEALGLTLGGPGYGVAALTMCCAVMALNTSGWLLFTVFFTGSMDRVRRRIAGGDVQKLALMTSGAMIGLFTYLSMEGLTAGFEYLAGAGDSVGMGAAVATISAFAAQMVLDRVVSARAPRFRSYVFGAALVIGTLAAYCAVPVK
ncbi:MAG: DUF5058 family protein [Synergistaceae bacterium]|jgi:hypothetical protein|nr:DUF5058 family protein [Synergistaceae bacterium]